MQPHFCLFSVGSGKTEPTLSNHINRSLGVLLAGLVLIICEAVFCFTELLIWFPIPRLAGKVFGHFCIFLFLFFFPIGFAFLGLTELSDRWLARGKKSIVAILWSALFLPLCVWSSFSLFSGGKMRLIPYPIIWSVLLLILSLSVIGIVVPRLLFLLASVMKKSWLERTLSALFLLTLLLFFQWADLRILPRLYPWFHVWLVLGKILFACLIGALLRPHFLFSKRSAFLCLVLLCVCGTLGVRSWKKIDRARTIRAFGLEHTLLPARLFALLPKGHKPAQIPILYDQEDLPPTYRGPRFSDRDVFLITVDAMRHDSLRPQTAPTLHGLSLRGITFTSAYTQVPHTSFSVASVLTGKPVYALSQLGPVSVGGHQTLPLMLRNYRYKTAAFYPPNVFFIERERLRWFEENAYGFEYVKVEYLPAERRTQQVIDFLETEKPTRVFAWIHYLEPHEPYEEHSQSATIGKTDRDRYDGEIRFVDQQIALFLSYLEKKRPGALLVIAADHGEEFGEHGGRYHGTTLFDEQARVPLVLVDTGRVPLLAPRRINQPVSLMDVTPTLLGLLDIEPPVQMQGKNWANWLLSGKEKLPLRGVLGELGTRKMLVLGDHKLLCDLTTDICQLFHLPSDPGEKRNLYEQRTRQANELKGRLFGVLQQIQRYEQSTDQTGKKDAPIMTNITPVLTRARLGDQKAVPELLHFLASEKADRNLSALDWEAVELLARLLCIKPNEEVNARNSQEEISNLSRRLAKAIEPHRVPDSVSLPGADRERKRWAMILLFGLSQIEELPKEWFAELLADPSALARQKLVAVLTLLLKKECGESQQKECIGAAISVLDAAMELNDPDGVKPLLSFLGKSKDRRATAPLLHHLQSVRSRVDVVSALGELADRDAVSALGNVLCCDPYVHVRAESARALRKIGGTLAQKHLEKSRKTEREETVIRATDGF